MTLSLASRLTQPYASFIQRQNQHSDVLTLFCLDIVESVHEVHAITSSRKAVSTLCVLVDTGDDNKVFQTSCMNETNDGYLYAYLETKPAMMI